MELLSLHSVLYIEGQRAVLLECEPLSTSLVGGPGVAVYESTYGFAPESRDRTPLTASEMQRIAERVRECLRAHGVYAE